MSEESLPATPGEQQRLLNALRESELLRELSELLASSLDLIHILNILAQRTTEACEVERTAVWLLDESRQCFLPSAYHMSASRITPDKMQIADRMWRRSRLPFNDPTMLKLLQEERGILLVEDLRTAPGTHIRAIADKFLVRSVLLVALMRDGRPLGMMSLDHPGNFSTFSTQQLQLARAIGQQAAVAIDHARLYEQAQTERRRAEYLAERLQSLHELSFSINSGVSLETVLTKALQHLVSGLDADEALLAITRDDHLHIVDRVTGKASSPSQSHEAYFSPSPPLSSLTQCLRAAQTRTPRFLSHLQAEGQEATWFRNLGLQQFLIVPLTIGHQDQETYQYELPGNQQSDTAGFALLNYARVAHEPAPEQRSFAQGIATQCALAIERDQMLSTTRKNADLATERANTLNTVFNAMTEGITVLDMSGQVIVKNNTAAQFFDLPLEDGDGHISFPEQLKRLPIYTLHGRRLSPADLPFNRSLHGERVRGERILTRRTDGSERTLEINSVPLHDGNNKQVGIVNAFRDVTEQVRVEQRVRLALDTMLHAVEVVSGVTEISDILRRVLSMTMSVLACERGLVLQYDEQEQLFTPFVTLGFVQAAMQQWLEAQQQWLIPGSDFHLQLLQGHAVLIHLPTSDENSEQLRTSILAAPITYNNRLLGVMMLDRTQDTAKMGNHSKKQQSLSMMARDFTVWDIAVAEGIAQFAGLAIEQTRWQQEAELARSQEQAMRASNALKDEFLAITAHEFRTPLTVILAHSQMMERTLIRAPMQTWAERLQDSIENIDIQAHHLTNIVNTYLEVTQLNRGQIALDLVEVRLEDVIKQAVINHSATASQHQISYSMVPARFPYLVMGDRARLLQIFSNLLHNAIKYSPLGGPITITLTQRQGEQGHKIIEASVKDRGIGVPKDAQPHLFESFYRAPNIHTMNDKVRGVGLGLYVVAEFLRLHGGTIRVESSGVEGEGSCFILTLPLYTGTRRAKNRQARKEFDT